MNFIDTIVAVATPSGRGGIGVVRISGPRTRDLAVAILGSLPEVRRAELKVFRDGSGAQIDQGIALFFSAPNSFTGEDILELHGHGGPIILDMVLARAVELGARMAEPGEFSQRAFLNDKLDLIQAEAVADLIDSGSQQAARAAIRSLQGDFSALAHEITEQLIATRMYIEAAIDFPEEEIDFLGDRELKQRLHSLNLSIERTLGNAQQGALLRDGMSVVIAGKPNAGKSSLLNALAGYDAAIVTPLAGTTRDVLRERINIDGMPLHIIDTAGLRETQDLIEGEGIRRAQLEMQRADRILYVIDGTTEQSLDSLQADIEQLPKNVPISLLCNKIDVGPSLLAVDGALRISAQTGAGIPELREHLKECAGLQQTAATTFSARRRHLDALIRAKRHVETAIELLNTRKAGELMAEELRIAQADIGEITGEVTSDDLLGKIFSSFCIGK